jgi:hypothetical protein
VTRPPARRLLTLLTVAALGFGACSTTSPSPSDAAPPDGSSDQPAAVDSIPPDAGPVILGQLGGEWRRDPIVLDEHHIGVISDACAAAARDQLGAVEGDLPTAMIDARGAGFATVILSDGDVSVDCAATIDDAGAVAVSGVHRLAVTSSEPQDGASISVSQVARDGDGDRARTVAWGRVGPGAAKVELGFADGSTIRAARNEGWWAAWWPGATAATSITALDADSAVKGTAKAPDGLVESRVGRASWWLDPTAAEPTAESDLLPVRVLEEACASGQSGLDRLDPPYVELTDTTVTLTMWIRLRPGPQDCQGNAPFAFDLELPEPLGARHLLDGGDKPPRDATKPPAG